MGVSLSRYVGPYLACPNPKVDRVVERRACATKTCDKFGNRIYDQTKFCSGCGGPITDDVKVTEQRARTEANDLSEEINERLCRFNWNSCTDDEEPVDYWVPNMDTDKIADRDLHGYLTSVVDHQIKDIRCLDDSRDLGQLVEADVKIVNR